MGNVLFEVDYAHGYDMPLHLINYISDTDELGYTSVWVTQSSCRERIRGFKAIAGIGLLNASTALPIAPK